MSRLPFELLLSLRYLRPKRTFVSVITVISILGVMLGVAVLIVVISVMTGFDRQLRERILGFNAHLRVYSARPFENYQQLVQVLEKNPQVKGVAPYVIGPVLAKTDPENGQGQILAPYLRGINPSFEQRVSNLPQSILPGGKFDVSDNGILVGRELASELDLRVGDKLLIYSIPQLEEMQRSEHKSSNEAVLPEDFEIRGIFDVGYYQYNQMFIVSSLTTAQDLYGLGNKVGGVIVMLNDPSKARQVRAEIGPQLGPGFRISTWEDENNQLLSAILVEKNVMFYLLFFIMVVAAFGITSALITFVVQKTREIGMLKALGATAAQVMWLFLSQSLIVGVFGVLAGFGLGLLAVHYRNEFLFCMRRLTGWELFPASIYNFAELPAYLNWGDIGIICGGSLVICILAGVIPAWSAGRLQPVEALRHE